MYVNLFVGIYMRPGGWGIVGMQEPGEFWGRLGKGVPGVVQVGLVQVGAWAWAGSRVSRE